MVNEVLFVGGRRETINIISGAPVDITTSGRFDSAYADSGLLCVQGDVFQHNLFTASASVLSSTTVVAGEKIFLHFEMRHAHTGNVGSVNLVEFRDNSGFPWFAIRGTAATGGHRLVYNSGTGASPVWTAIGADFTLAVNTIHTIDLELLIGSPHSVTLYLNGSMLRTGTFSQASLVNVAAVRYASSLDSTIAANNACFSQIMCTRNISTVGGKVKYSRATGAGANTAWTNSFTAVNEAVSNDATLQSAATAGLKSTHAMGDVTVPSGFEIGSVFHWLRAKNDGSAPNNIKSVLRQSGVDYSTGNLSGLGTGFAPVGARYDTDPSGTPWTQSTWNAIEAGYEAAT